MNILFNFLQYFFEITPSTPFKYQVVTIIIAVLILGASIALRIYLKKTKEDKTFRKLFRSLPAKLQSIAICFGIYVVARYGNIPFLSMRVLNYLLIVLTFYVIIQNLRLYMKEYPEIQKRRLEQSKLNKYLPRKKVR